MSITIVGEKFNIKNGYDDCSRSHVVVKCNECESKNFIIRYSDKHLIQSCGCTHKTRTHNLSSSSTYRIWRGMKSRCTNNKCKEYDRYGGRGITICERWGKFEMFLEDMGIRPEGLSLDRVDNDKGYCKENCRWATVEEQNRNKRNNTFLTIDGKTMTISEWVEQDGAVSFSTIWARITHGFTDHHEIVFSKPHSRSTKKHLTIDGITKSIADWSRDEGAVPYSAIHARLRRGIPAKEAVFTESKKSGKSKRERA